MGTAINSDLRGRIAELEGQLDVARRTAATDQAKGAELRDALAYSESIVDTLREPLLVLDGGLRVKSASRGFFTTFAVSDEETIGQFIYDLGNGQWNIPGLRTLLDEILPKGKSLRDFQVTHDFPELGTRVMLLNARKLWREVNGTELVLLAIEDITERNRLEDELLRSNEDLQRFAYVAAHDLRSPLLSALSVTHLLAERLKGRVEEEESHLLTVSIENMERMAVLMRDILTYAELGNAPQPPTLVPMHEPLNIALANLRYHIEESGAVITVGELPSAPADRTQIAMVFQNLLGNALKYRRSEAPHITIAAVQEDDRAQISVSDNGTGFDNAYAAQIFEPFKRLHGESVPGTGIGLATCKRIVERLGGRIWAVSRPGEGSTFSFALPVSRSKG
jgi:signal transduction histidine kinase